MNVEKNIQATLQWVQQSIAATGQQGSAAYFHVWKGWAPAYPETTGYLIETLFDYASHLHEKMYKNLAISCADWLCTIQNADGSFPGGVGTAETPVVFDTGQILFGLTRSFLETQEHKYQTALAKAVNWLLTILESDGSWQRYAYVKGYIPSYYTRVVWAVLYANQVLQWQEVTGHMEGALHFYAQKITAAHTVRDWGFRPGEAAYTHTIAYTMRGFLESGYLLQKKSWILITQQIADQLLDNYNKKDKLAGSYDVNWIGNYNFTCVTGNYQLALVLGRLFQLTGENRYRAYAKRIFQDPSVAPWRLPIAGFYGGIPGSQPLWGRYQRFTFPNWAAKFYLDAALLLKQLDNAQDSLVTMAR